MKRWKRFSHAQCVSAFRLLPERRLKMPSLYRRWLNGVRAGPYCVAGASFHLSWTMYKEDLPTTVSWSGELTFLELLMHSNRIRGSILFRLAYVKNKHIYWKPEKIVDINQFPALWYDFSSGNHFKLKGMRQIVFILHRDALPLRVCADPYVYSRRWSGLKGSRMLFDVFDAWEISCWWCLFQDENFLRINIVLRNSAMALMNFRWNSAGRQHRVPIRSRH